MSDTALCDLGARELRERIGRREVSAREVVDAHLDRIETCDAALNAVVTRVPEAARSAAADADERQARGDSLGPLHGLPIAYKDLVQTAGIRTTMGSPLLENHVPTTDDLIVERLRGAGAITVGKTNTPEFGAGSQTFNPVFGATRNPYDTTKTCGGSSGGAAVALAAGMLPIADGSDMGGSLRNPANFCNVVGFRPSPGRVPVHPARHPWSPLAVLGPMARSVGDAALLFSAMAGPDPRVPLAIRESGDRFAGSLDRDFRGVRVAWSADLGGLPFDPRVREATSVAPEHLRALGCVVAPKEPDLSAADHVFRVLRSASFLASLAGIDESAIARCKDTIQAEWRAANRLSAADLSLAESNQGAVFHRMREFLDEYEYLVLPVSQVPPFDVETPYPTEVDGTPMETYIDWMKSCFFITVTSHPAISVPCGFTPDGLPVGIQIVGRMHDDWGVLQIAHAFEQAAGASKRRPPAEALRRAGL